MIQTNEWVTTDKTHLLNVFANTMSRAQKKPMWWICWGGEKMDDMLNKKKKKKKGGKKSQESQLCKHVSVRNIEANPKFGIQKHDVKNKK